MINHPNYQVSKMPTNRELYFQLLGKKNKYLTRLVVKELLNDVNGFSDGLSLYKHFDEECPNYEKLVENSKRVEDGEPFQYVLGYANFIDLLFEVNKNVLIPRQETEELVIHTKRYIEKYLKDRELDIADVCTGSGAIGISLKKYFPKANVTLTDISKEALEVAKYNSEKLGFKVDILEGDMLSPLIEKGIKLDVLVCNPPYIENIKTIDEQVWKYEPHQALLASPKTKFYEEVFKNADKIMKAEFILAFEIGEDMEDELSIMVENYFPDAMYTIAKDMYGKTRFLYIIRKEGMNYA